MMIPALCTDVSQTAPRVVLASSDLPQRVLVGITELLKQSCSGLCRGCFVVCDAVHAQMVLDNVRDSLCVGCRA